MPRSYMPSYTPQNYLTQIDKRKDRIACVHMYELNRTKKHTGQKAHTSFTSVASNSYI